MEFFFLTFADVTPSPCSEVSTAASASTKLTALICFVNDNAENTNCLRCVTVRVKRASECLLISYKPNVTIQDKRQVWRLGASVV